MSGQANFLFTLDTKTSMTMSHLVISLIVSLITVGAVTGISFSAPDPKYPGAELIPLGRPGLDRVLDSMNKIELTDEKEPLMMTDVKKLLPDSKKIEKVVNGKISFDNITFFGPTIEWPAASSFERKFQFYGDYNDAIAAERYWGQFNVKHNSFLANVSFTRAKDDEYKTCPVVGLSKVRSDGSNLLQNIHYDIVVIREPFKFIGNRWSRNDDENKAGYLTYMDSNCGGFQEPVKDTSKLTYAMDKGLSFSHTLGKTMREFYEKWAIEGNRFHLIGQPKMNNSIIDIDNLDVEVMLFQTEYDG